VDAPIDTCHEPEALEYFERIVVRMPTFSHVTLQTNRLRLRPLGPTDAPAVLRMFTNTKFMEFVASPLFGSIDEANALVARDMAAMASGERLRLGIERVEDGVLIGNCTLFKLDEESRKAEISYGLLGSALGKGYMHEALTALLTYGFSTLNLNRVHAEVDPKNVKSVASLERIGFSKEGVLRESCIFKSVVSDTAVYGLLQNEWKHRVAGAVR
jgi:RimJ/RimL family protein N-acetyltransferase